MNANNPKANADHARYSEWDAAYVLGSLSPAERREFETHLETCDRCSAAIAELAALPGLLGRLTPAQGMAVLDEERAEPGPAPDLIARITSLDKHRRRRRARLFGGLAAAALLVAATAVAVPLAVQSTQPPAIPFSSPPRPEYRSARRCSCTPPGGAPGST